MKFSLTLLTLSLLAAVSLQARPLEVWISSQQDKIYYENMINLYQQEVDEDFEANVSAFGFQEMPDKLAVSIRSGVNPPDIVQLDEILFGIYLGGESPFVDLAGRVKEAGLDKTIAPQRLSLFSSGEKIYGVPQSLSAMVMYYRKDLFEEYDLTPEKLATWDDFMAEGYRLAEEQQPLIGLDASYFEILLRQRGSDLFDEEGNVFPDMDLAADTLEWLKEMFDERIGILPERENIFDPIFFSGIVEQGGVLCLIGADWYGLDMIQQFAPSLSGKWGVMPLPAWHMPDGTLSRRTSTFAGQGLMIYKESTEIDPSWEFIKFVMTNKEANAERFLKGNSFPAYMPAWEDERLLQPNEYFGDMRFGKILADLGPEVPEVVTSPLRPQAVFMWQENFFSTAMYTPGSGQRILEEMKAALEQQ